MTSPGHRASIEYSHGSFGARVGRAIASRNGRLSSTAEHCKREMRAHASQVLRTTFKQTPVYSSDLNGRPAASRVSTTSWRGCLAGIVSIPASTSKRAKLEAPRGRRTYCRRRLGCSCRDACALCVAVPRPSLSC
jgi:hypothetical protein